ncbi:MAG: glutathione S-transferase family protein [Bacteroidales bacterium]
MERPRLIVLGPSHYCERARWALDHAGIAYDEIRWAPALHIPQARRLAPQSFVPILVTGAAVIQGSDRILDWLGTAGGVADVEHRVSETVAPLVRRYLYSATLHDARSGISDVLLDGVQPLQARAGKWLWPVIRRLMAMKMDIDPALLPELEGRIESELAWFGDIVANCDHLAGDCLGRADITAASLLAPLLRGPAVVPMYDRVRLPDDAERALARWNQTPALRWVRRLYQSHRHQSSATRSR